MVIQGNYPLLPIDTYYFLLSSIKLSNIIVYTNKIFLGF